MAGKGLKSSNLQATEWPTVLSGTSYDGGCASPVKRSAGT